MRGCEAKHLLSGITDRYWLEPAGWAFRLLRSRLGLTGLAAKRLHPKRGELLGMPYCCLIAECSSVVNR